MKPELSGVVGRCSFHQANILQFSSENVVINYNDHNPLCSCLNLSGLSGADMETEKRECAIERARKQLLYELDNT
jgi:hypothetical protein